MQRLAVIVPFYHHQSYLPDTIHSIKSQINVDDSIFLINDDPDVKLNEYNHLFRVNVYEDGKNKGQSARFNQGIKMAKDQGIEWVSFCGADDTWMSWRYSTIHHLKKDFDVIYTDAVQLDAGSMRSYIKSNEFNYRQLIERNYIVASTVLVRTEIAIQCHFDEDIHYGEDWLWYLKLAQITRKFHYINLPTVYYRNYTSQIAQKTNIREWRSNRQKIHNMIQELYDGGKKHE